MKKFLLSAGIILLGGSAAAYFFVPWNTLAERQLTTYLEARGVYDVSFSIEKVGLYETMFGNIRIGKETPLLLQSVKVQYSPRELWDRNVQSLTLTGLDISVSQTESGWHVAGFNRKDTNVTKQKPSIGLSDIIDLLPVSSIEVKDSHLRIMGQAVQTTLPFSMRLTKTPKTILEMTIHASDLTAASSDVSLGVITLKATPDEQRNWNGIWNASSVNLGEALPVPVLKGNGNLKYAGNIIGVDGGLASQNNDYRANFALNADLSDNKKSTLALKSASFPFKEGRVSASNTIIPFDRSKNIRINMNVSKVSLNELLQTLTGQKVTATGTVSGAVPVILRTDGTYTLGQGTLKSDVEGIIQMPGALIPGDNEQVQLVRQIVENLHYSTFSASIDTTGEKGLAVRLALEGNNPDVYNGRAVKLNINLTGDVLDFIQQNAMLITNPEKFLRQVSHE
jgi:hypothetical protein